MSLLTPVATNPTQKPSLATSKAATPATEQSAQSDEQATVRLHITPFNPALLKAYLAPSVLPLATNISYHAVETFPEKGFGYLNLPAMEAQKLKKKLNGSTLKGSKVRVEDAKPEKRKASDDAEAVKENEERPAKRTKKAKKQQHVLEGVELPDDRTIKRGWTEPPAKSKKEKKDKKDKKATQKESKYTKEPEMLFKAKLTPVAATEAARKEKSKDKKKDKKSKSKREVVVHEFEKSSKQPSFLKLATGSTEKKPAVEYVNGKGWVDEDGNVVEAETGKARNRRVLELVDSTSPQPTTEKKLSATPEPVLSPKSIPKAKPTQKTKKKKVTPPPSSSESDAEDSSVVSSSSENEAVESEVESEAESSASSPAPAADTPQIALTPSSPDEKKDVHPLEALFKRPRPAPLSSPTTSNPTSTPVKGLAPINTSFSFFDNNEPMDVDSNASGNPPTTPFTQRDLEWRGLRSAAPTPDTAAIGKRFSFPWRKGSHEVDDDDNDEDDDIEAGKQLSNNTKANASVSHLPGLVEEDEEEDAEGGANKDAASEKNEDEEDEGNDADGDQARVSARTRSSKNRVDNEEGEKEESEFGKWFWENRGENNRAWKKRRRDTLKAKRLRDNRKITGGRRVG